MAPVVLCGSGHRDERRVDAGEQHRERERLALRTENSARAAASEHEGRRVVDVGQHAVASDRGAAGGERVDALAAAGARTRRADGSR